MSTDSRIKLLTDLHHPLEDHRKNARDCDAKGSDHLYKHHVTRLRDVYVTTPPKPSPPKEMANPPVITQLYGVTGLKTKRLTNKKLLSSREAKWNSRIIVKDYDKDLDKPRHITMSPSPSTLRRSESPNPSRPSTANARMMQTTQSLNNLEISRYNSDSESEAGKKTKKSKKMLEKQRLLAEEAAEEEEKQRRNKCTKKGMANEDITIIGLYRMSDEQQEIYHKFTKMLSQFDDFDVKNILSDVAKDVAKSTLLDDYGGTQISKET